MPLPDHVVQDLRRRLRRVEGQVTRRRVDAGRGSRVSGYRDAVQCREESIGEGRVQVGCLGLTYCVQHPEEAAPDGYAIEQVQHMSMKLT